MTGVQPKMSALLATEVRATPPRKRAWQQAVADQRQADDGRPVSTRDAADRRVEAFPPRDDGEEQERGQHHPDPVEPGAGQLSAARP